MNKRPEKSSLTSMPETVAGIGHSSSEDNRSHSSREHKLFVPLDCDQSQLLQKEGHEMNIDLERAGKQEKQAG